MSARAGLLALCLLSFVLPGPVAAAPARTLAVAPFDNHTADPSMAPLGRGLAEMLITDLSQVAGLQVVERARLQEIQGELKLQQSAWADPATAAKVGRGVGASWILVGSLAAVAPTMRIDARIVEVQTGKVAHARSASGPTAEFFLLEKELAQGLLQDLGVAASAREQAALGRVATESFDAALAWSQGLEAIDKGAVEEAAAALQAALEADDRFALASQALDRIRTRLAELDRKAAQQGDSRLQSLLLKLDGMKKGTGPWEELPTLLGPFLSIGADPKSARVAVSLGGRIAGLQVPETVTMGAYPNAPTVNEWSLATMTLGLWALGRDAELLTWGQTFLERYPNSSWAPSVRPFLKLALDRIGKAEKARGDLPRIRAEAWNFVDQSLCGQEPDAERRIAACRRWIDTSLALKLDSLSRARDGLVRAAEYAGDSQIVKTAIDEALARDPYAAEASNWRSTLERIERDQRNADAAEGKLAGAKDGAAHARLVRDIADAGRWQRALALVEEGVKRYPPGDEHFALAIELSRQRGEPDRAEAWLRRWESAREKGATVNPDRARAARDLRGQLQSFREAEAVALSMFAGKCNAVGLGREAGDAWMMLAERWPEYGGSKAADSLNLAAWAYYAAGKPEAARRAWETLLEKHADSSVADAARSGLNMLPR